MIEYFPLFYYSGSKRWGLPSDRDFIQQRLNCLPVDKRITVSKEYDKIYMAPFSAGGKAPDRKGANEFLQALVKDIFSEPTPEERERKANDDAWVTNRIRQIKAMQRSKRKRIVLD